MKHTGLSPGAGSPAALGQILDTILPAGAGTTTRQIGVNGPLHRRVLAALHDAGYPLTVWDVKRAVYGPHYRECSQDGAVLRVLRDFMAAGTVQFVGHGYQLRDRGAK